MRRGVLAGALACTVLIGPSVPSGASQPVAGRPSPTAAPQVELTAEERAQDVEISTKRRYRDLTFSQLCQRSKRAIFNKCRRGEVMVNGKSFRYQIKSCCFRQALPPYAIDAARSSCKFIQVRYAVSDPDVADGAYAMGIGLTTDDPGSYTELNATPGTVGKAKIRIGLPSHWRLFSYANPMDRFPVYLRGKVRCFTRTGDR